VNGDRGGVHPEPRLRVEGVRRSKVRPKRKAMGGAWSAAPRRCRGAAAVAALQRAVRPRWNEAGV
jgi:hypothetical protein